MFKSLSLLYTKIKYGFFSPEYYELYTHLYSNRIMEVFAVKPATGLRFEDHFRQLCDFRNCQKNHVQGHFLLSRVDLGASFLQCMEELGKPLLFNAAYEKGVPMMVAGYKHSANPIVYKTLYFFSGNQFLMNEIHIYNSTDQQHMSFARELLKRRSISVPLNDADLQLFTDNNMMTIAVIKEAFMVKIIFFHEEDQHLQKIINQLCNTTRDKPIVITANKK